MEIGSIPWLLAILTAGWFGWTAFRAGRTVTLWVVGGFAFGLVISTIVLGLGQASTIPFSGHERTAAQFRWTLAAVVIIVGGGWVLTSGLHRHHLILWRRFRPGAGETSTNAEAGPPSTSVGGKHSTGRP